MSFALSGSAAAPRFVRVVRRARFAVGALGAVVLARLVFLVWELRLHAGPRPPAPPGDPEDGYHRVPTALEEQYHYLGDLTALTLVVCVLGLVYWLQAMRDNADVLAPEVQRHARPWVWFSWIVPGISVWFPRDVVVDVWRAAAPRDENPAERRTPWWINVWWLFLLGAVAMLLVTENLSDDGQPEAETVYDAFRSVLATDFFLVAAAVLTIVLVVRMTRDQEERTGD
ncbi:DUF4328 domain-containing protein [Streptomyces sp. SID11385]|uniref:DUF4328 domain-containing protein n=1 Tax=Streptomyces sp. SID11385 TaxID=2706031 RepID=UPI0013CA34BD|nr:DUF4328 domain-containing protein [Streptomyces sp. SID11385]NEA39484.1 DUF4328 domain-containing protein [Streptomyces sp. SID11385]